MKSAFIAKQFDIEGRVFSCEALIEGNVNDTYLAIYRTVFSETRAVIQRINTYVFKEPDKLMENMHRVTEHVHKVYEAEQDDPDTDRIWQLPKVIPTRDGKDFFIDDEDNYWRAITQIASAKSYDKIQNAEHAHDVGAVLGKVHHAISDMPCDSLHDTLPGFHITPGYFPKLDEALQTKEGKARLDATRVAHNVLVFLEKRRDWCSVLEDAKARGELSVRPIHGDPKTANVMIDDMTNKGTAIIDLDTGKPGLVHTDIADCLRSCCNPAGEETHDISSVTFDMDLADAVLSGYREQARGFLTEGEKEYLFDAVRLIAYEQALRFFADYIAGDVYYKVREDGQNLMLARVQVQLCRSIEANEPKIRRMLSTL
ncbi:MAG: phosphotransferase [Victivallales bacterium]|nr:phosphotransferase [Victivallales bacterium]